MKPEDLPNTEEGIQMKFHAMNMMFKHIVRIGDSLPPEMSYQTYLKLMEEE